MDLGIQSQECNQCGAMIYPNSLISTKGEQIKVEKYTLPKLASSMTDDELILQKLYDEIQVGLHDANPNLKRFKGKVRVTEVTDILRAEHQARRNAAVAVVNQKELDYKRMGNGVSQLISKNVTRTEMETEVTLEIKRHLAILTGNKNNGTQKCPLCGFVLVSWNNIK